MSTNKDVMDALMRGIEIEKETFDFYTKAEQRTFDPEGKKIFRWLAKSEEVHYLKLTELYNTLGETGHWVFYGGCTISLGTIGPINFETDGMEALRLAMDIEQKGVGFYNELLTKISDPGGRSMIQTLRAEEEEHLRVINEKYQAIEKR